MSSFDRLVDALHERGLHTKAIGPDRVMAQCPAHEDPKESLSLRDLPGQVLVWCFAGCQTREVVDALDLSMTDLFDDPHGIEYRYLDEDGNPTRTVRRTPDKQFSQSGNKNRLILYRLPEVIEAVRKGRTVYLVEGEKDADALVAAGQTATTAPQGAQSIAKVDLGPLQGASVVAIPDNDGAGLKWAQVALDRLANFAKSVSFRKAAKGKDFADHYAAGLGVSDLIDITDKIGPARRKVELKSGDKIERKAVTWLWKNDRGEKWLPMGSLSLLGGRENVGKSTIAYWIAAQVTQGTLPGKLFGHPRGVIVVAKEDSWEHTVMNRMDAAGANDKLVFRADAIEVDGSRHGLTLPTDNDDLRRLTVENDIGFILLDPLMSTVSGRLDSYKDHDVRLALEPLSALAHDTKATVLGLIHQNKNASGDILSRLMASRAFTAVARVVLVAQEDKNYANEEHGVLAPPRQFVFGQGKNNLGAAVTTMIKYTITEKELGYDAEADEPITAGAVAWGEEFTGDIEDFAGQDKAKRTDRTRDRAIEWLRVRLANGPAPSKEIKDAAQRVGIALPTLKRAMTEMEIIVSYIPGTSATQWSLPSTTTEPHELSDPPELDGPDEPLLQKVNNGMDQVVHVVQVNQEAQVSHLPEPPPRNPVEKGKCQFCSSREARLYPRGWRCADHRDS